MSCSTKLDNKGKNKLREDVYYKGLILTAACNYDGKVLTIRMLKISNLNSLYLDYIYIYPWFNSK